MRETKVIKAEGGVGNQKNNTCYSGKIFIIGKFSDFIWLLMKKTMYAQDSCN